MISIVHQLRIARGGNAKASILRQHSDNEEWKQYLRLVYDTSVNYYVSAPKDTSFVTEVDSLDMQEDLFALTSRTYTGNAARQFALACSRKYGELFRMVLEGSIKAGVSTTSINKAYPNLIPVLKLMLAKDVQVVTFPCIISTKYDGVRLLARVENNKVTLILRSGKVVYISSLVKALSNVPDGVYDGEIVSGDGLQAGRTTISGQVNKCLKGTATDITGYSFCIFDLLKIEEWDTETSERDYYQRISQLHVIMVGRSKPLVFAEMTTATTLEQVDAKYKMLLARGYEGLIVRYLDDRYTWDTSSKRSGLMIKKKANLECVLHCVNVTEGTKKYEGMIGALMCEGEVDGKEIRVKLGSGLTDKDREQDPYYFIGKNVDVLYNDVVKDKKNNYHSLFLPRFKRIVGDYNV